MPLLIRRGNSVPATAFYAFVAAIVVIFLLMCIAFYKLHLRSLARLRAKLTTPLRPSPPLRRPLQNNPINLPSPPQISYPPYKHSFSTTTSSTDTSNPNRQALLTRLASLSNNTTHTSTTHQDLDLDLLPIEESATTDTSAFDAERRGPPVNASYARFAERRFGQLGDDVLLESEGVSSEGGELWAGRYLGAGAGLGVVRPLVVRKGGR